MEQSGLPGVGMRKIKSLLAIALCCVLWQPIRLALPGLPIHPLFGYMYSVIEMRQSVEQTRQMGWRRIKATLLGLVLGLLALPLSQRWGVYAGESAGHVLADLAIILAGVLLTLWLAQLLRCENFCGIAAIIFIICLVRDRDVGLDPYVYAVLRVVQTLLGVLAAGVVNTLICPRSDRDEPHTGCCKKGG